MAHWRWSRTTTTHQQTGGTRLELACLSKRVPSRPGQVRSRSPEVLLDYASPYEGGVVPMPTP